MALKLSEIKVGDTFEETLVEVELEQVKVDAARFEQELRQLDYHREQLLLSERRLTAPFDGAIMRTYKEVGEGVDHFDEIIAEVQRSNMSKNGDVDLADLAALLAVYGTACP